MTSPELERFGPTDPVRRTRFACDGCGDEVNDAPGSINGEGRFCERCFVSSIEYLHAIARLPEPLRSVLAACDVGPCS